jgi:hypothetical protein
MYIWLAAGQPLDDALELLPACGIKTCVSHLEARRVVDLGPDC